MMHMASPRKITLKKEDTCVGCGCVLGVGVEAWWDRQARTVTCPMCRVIEVGLAQGADSGSGGQSPKSPAPPGRVLPQPPEDTRGSAGSSALREYERRKANREKRVREKHPLLGGAILALQGSPQHEVAFKKGAAGEKAVADFLEKRLADSPVVLMHDRRMPGGRGNIDHLAVAPTGVYVIDAKNLEGKVKIDAPLFGKKKLIVKGRNRTKLIDGLDRQVAAVNAALAESTPLQPAGPAVPVHGILCFIRAELPLFSTLKMRGHHLLGRRGTLKRLNASGPLDSAAIQDLASQLAIAFPAA